MIQHPIRVLLVDDSPMALAVLRRILESSPDIEVVGTAPNGREALKLVLRLRPAVICTDLHMPVMDGWQFTQEVMDIYPCPILVISSTDLSNRAGRAYRAVEAGALDVFPKPSGMLGPGYARTKEELVGKIRVLAGVRVFRRPKAKGTEAMEDGADTDPPVAVRPPTQWPAGTPASGDPGSLKLPGRPRVIAIGASTGGPPALRDLLCQLPAEFDVPVLCVQHISEGFLAGLVNWLDVQCAIQVKIAHPGEVPLPGTAYFPMENTHLEVGKSEKLLLSRTAPVDGHRPSATVLLSSVARYYGSAAIGVLLTGMGKDGGQGMLELFQCGGTTIAQDEQSCAVFGMPKAAIDLGAARYVMPPTRIGQILAGLEGST